MLSEEIERIYVVYVNNYMRGDIFIEWKMNLYRLDSVYTKDFFVVVVVIVLGSAFSSQTMHIGTVVCCIKPGVVYSFFSWF